MNVFLDFIATSYPYFPFWIASKSTNDESPEEYFFVSYILIKLIYFYNLKTNFN